MVFISQQKIQKSKKTACFRMPLYSNI